MPLTLDSQGPNAEYCRYCTDENGQLRPRDEVKQGIATWLQSLQEGITEERAIMRAEHFMQAMPAWADD